MPLDPFYHLPPETQARVMQRAKEKLLRVRSLSLEERKQAAERAMNFVDSLPKEWRALVHEFGVVSVKRALNKNQTARQFLLSKLDFNL